MSAADAPITHSGDDRLKRQSLVDALEKMLVAGKGRSSRATRVTIGLTGAWGSGKSSILALLNQRLSSRANVLVVQFNPWIFQGRDDLLVAFFDELTAQLGGKRKVEQLLNAFQSYREALEPILEAVQPGASLAAKAVPRRAAKSALEVRAELAQRLGDFEGAMVVLIDELDRVEDEEVRSMARLIKAIGDLPNISYLVAYDRARVQTALARSSGAGDGAAYLEKIIQFPIPLRPLMDYEVVELLSDGLLAAGYDPSLKDRALLEELKPSLVRLLDTPRAVKRLLSSFQAMEKMVAGEVNPVDVLGYAALCTKGAAERDYLADNLDRFVNDPILSELEAIAEAMSQRNETPEDLFPSIDPALSSLLTFLFPRLNGETDHERFGRIQHRRNLLSMLYLGDPPFQTSRKEVERFWLTGDRELLTKKRASGTIDDFVGVLQSIMAELPRTNDALAWEALADEVNSGEGERRASGRRLARRLRELLIRFAAGDQKARERARLIARLLVDRCDFGIAPEIVRYHMFAHGLIEGTTARNGPTIYSRAETEALIEQELARYHEYVRSGQWLEDALDADPAWALQQGDKWTEELRAVVHQQLEEPGNISRFASLFVAPEMGSITRAQLRNFVDEEVLEGRVDLEAPEDSWSELCLLRLKRVLAWNDADTTRPIESLIAEPVPQTDLQEE